jgi:hypothetical protein
MNISVSIFQCENMSCDVFHAVVNHVKQVLIIQYYEKAHYFSQNLCVFLFVFITFAFAKISCISA